MSGPIKVAGPYWVKTVESGEHHVCGRNGAVMFRYPAEQEALATAHVRRLQAGHKKAEKQIREAAPVLLAALEFVSTDPCFSLLGSVTQDEVRAALIKASASSCVPGVLS